MLFFLSVALPTLIFATSCNNSCGGGDVDREMCFLVKGVKCMIHTRQHTKPSSIVMGSLFKAHLFSNLAAEVDEMNTIAVDNNTVVKKRISKRKK